MSVCVCVGHTQIINNSTIFTDVADLSRSIAQC